MKITHKILWIMIMVMTLSATLGLGNVIRTDKAGAMIKQDQTIQKAAVIRGRPCGSNPPARTLCPAYFRCIRLLLPDL